MINAVVSYFNMESGLFTVSSEFDIFIINFFVQGFFVIIDRFCHVQDLLNQTLMTSLYTS